ncbi:C1 family peptidase [Pyxidicoccus sp. MSG2]|uniref:C1 family peptidase n=1 Tax=Pyxidicoccus sp. MSG2 TaxID=2996790 RepID=UPI00226DEAE1|nr:C1 family peptidase [Pyxidicoccus sp. MSG2]MCY1020129.1 C1 family peptidase [Pyxidicoccus sp. MSG2]
MFVFRGLVSLLLLSFSACIETPDPSDNLPGENDAGGLPDEPGVTRRLGLELATAAQLEKMQMAVTPFAGEELPARVDLSGKLPPPGDQGNQSSCVGWAVAYALKSYQEKVEEGWGLTGSGGGVDAQHVFSPAFIYNQINHGQDRGSLFSEALDLMAQQGAATLADMPYDARDFQSAPGGAARANAKRFKIETWRRIGVSDLRGIKGQLHAGFPVLIGAKVDQGFTQMRQGSVWSSSSGGVLGGHAMALVGYDDARRAFKLINSWGSGWGDQGYGWVAYEHFPSVVVEAYVAKDADNGNGPSPSPDGGTAPDAGTGPDPVPPTSTVQVAQVQHNVSCPYPGLPYCMRLSGTVAVGAGAGSQGQVVVHVFWDAGGGSKGQLVAGTMPFVDVMGQAATGTSRLAIPGSGLQMAWSADLPYASLQIPRGGYDPFGVYHPYTSFLVAEPAVFVDGFAVAVGGSLPFYVGL